MAPRKLRAPFTDFNRMVMDLDEKSDRDLAILGCSLLDVALEQSIVAKLVPLEDADLKPVLRVFQSLTNKIHIAHATGVIDRATKAECHNLAAVRNVFAHSLYDLNCDSEPVAKAIRKLADPSDKDAYDWTASLPAGAHAEPFPAYLDKKLGRVWINDLAVVVDAKSRVLFYVRMLAESPTNNRDKLLYSLWNCINAACGASLLSWREASGLQYPGE